MKRITSREYHDRIAVDYDARYGSSYWRLFREITWDNLRQFLPRRSADAKILDFGTGTGTWAVRLAELGFVLVCVDTSPAMLEQARNKLRGRGLDGMAELVEADVADLGDFPAGAFSMVVAEGDVLSYCARPLEAATEIARVLAPGGAAVISVRNKLFAVKGLLGQGRFSELAELLSTGRLLMPTELEGEGVLCHLFTPEDLRRLIGRVKLAVARIIGKTVFAPFADPALLDDDTFFRRALEMERLFCDELYALGSAAHLEIVGRKRS